jgi:hypothetical protein
VNYFVLSNGLGAWGSPIVVVGILVLILVIIWIILKLYETRVEKTRPVEHLCDYCGHMVLAVSDCHHAPVKERFLHGVCRECGRETRLVCEKCKRPL